MKVAVTTCSILPLIVVAVLRLGDSRAAGQSAHPAPTPPAAVFRDVFPVAIRVDAAQQKGELRPIWRFFGADEPNYAYMKDGKKLLKELGDLRPQTVYFRTHNLLTTGDGMPALKWGSTNVYTEDASGNPIYDWTIVDRIFDTYLQRGVKPYVQIGFMPKALLRFPFAFRQSSDAAVSN